VDSKRNLMVIFSAACLASMTMLLMLGESTLPLFGGNRELAGHVYVTIFMLFGAWTVAGLAVLGMQIMKRFTDYLLSERPDVPHVQAMNWLCTHTQPIVFTIFILIGIAMAVWVWAFDTGW